MMEIKRICTDGGLSRSDAASGEERRWGDKPQMLVVAVSEGFELDDVGEVHVRLGDAHIGRHGRPWRKVTLRGNIRGETNVIP